MKKIGISLILIFIVVFVGFSLTGKTTSNKNLAFQNQVQATLPIDGIKISAQKTHENLTLFILSGEEKVKGNRYKTLSQAMKTKDVTVKETGSVNELSIDNNSDDYIFIHSGDIVKGGKQDRTISYDVIIPPNTKNVSLQSFCVESGRWEKRSGENVAAFSSNTKMLSSRDLKLAAKHEKNQSKVWAKVSEQKNRLSHNLTQKNGYTVNVSDNESDTSLQLALENKDLLKVKETYYNIFKDLINTPDAIGYSYAINGEIYGVELYNNQMLFKDLWDKILESVIVEAISKEGEEVFTEVTHKDITNFITASAKEKEEEKLLNKTTRFSTAESEEGNIVFSTKDEDKKQWIHKSYMKIDKTMEEKKDSRVYPQRQRSGN